mgnify:CR=1 FL=1
MLLTFLCALIVAALVLFWFFGRRPYKNKNISQKEIATYIQLLLDRGFDGGVLVIEVPKTHYFVQFSKYIIRPGVVGLRLSFPRAPWSEELFAGMRRLVEEKGYFYRLENVEKGNVSGFLVVDLKTAVDKATELTQLILARIFTLDSLQTVDITCWNISHLDEKIGF